MKVDIANHEYTIVWNGVYYFALSEYPLISEWELRKLVCFIQYEKSHGRDTEIICNDKSIIAKVNDAIAHPEKVIMVQKPLKITECTACKQKGCLTDFVCHTASKENAKSILTCGRIFSAVNAMKKSGRDFVNDIRNTAGDPPDYFDYIMLAWGNCQAGDMLMAVIKYRKTAVLNAYHNAVHTDKNKEIETAKNTHKKSRDRER